MGRKIFTVRGRVAYAGGEPAAGVWVAVVDGDPDSDDLIGVGLTSKEGDFRLSFTAEAFNQEPGEAEDRPDLYLVLSVDNRGARVPVLRRDFPGLRFDAEEDLGTTVLPLRKGASPTPMIGLRASPGQSKIVKRLRLDDDLVRATASEIATLVQRLTGFSEILAGVRLAMVDSFADLQRRRFERLLAKSELSPQELDRAQRNAASCDVSTLGLWDFRDFTVYLNRPLLEAQNLDALRITLGHELVHVGQSKAHPELDAEHEILHEQILARAVADQIVPPEMLDAATRLMSNIEGYASYIENHLLSFFTHGTTIWGAGQAASAALTERRNRRPATGAPMTWQQILDASAAEKTRQYAAGRDAYLARASGSDPAPFDPKLRPEPRYGEAAMLLLAVAAQAGDPTAQFDFGFLFLQGKGGIERDVEVAKTWFRKAADQGHAFAAYSLGALLPATDPERRALWTKAAAQGFVPAKRMLEHLG